MEQRKNFKSGEHLISTKGQNWWTSKPASSWVSWFSSFGIRVMLYPIPRHMGMVISSHFPSPSDDDITDGRTGDVRRRTTTRIWQLVAIILVDLHQLFGSTMRRH